MYEVRVVRWDRSSVKKIFQTDRQVEFFVERTSRSPLVAAIFVAKEGKREKKVYGARASENPNKDK